MSASTDRRVARLVGRIAEERAARGRPAISHAPRIARTFSVEIVRPPTIQGGEANVMSTLVLLDGFITLDSSGQPGLGLGRQGGIDLTRTVARTRRVEEFHPVSTGGNAHVVRFETDYAESVVTITALGVDYAELDNSASGNGRRFPLDPDDTKPGPEMTLVDRLFAGF